MGPQWSVIMVVSLLATAAMVADPLVAERLITADGKVIETRGPWQLRGKTVVFTTPTGTLSSVRASEIDFAATELANQPASTTPQAEASPTRRESVLVLTDKDIGPGTAVSSAGAAAAAEVASPTALNAPSGSTEAGATSAAPAALVAPAVVADKGSVFVAHDLEIRDWRLLDDGQIGGIELVGTLVNRGTAVAVDLGVTVRFAGREGEESHEAFVGSPTVGPGRAVNFRIPLPDVVTPPDAPTFEVHGRGLRPRILGSAPKPDAEETSPEG